MFVSFVLALMSTASVRCSPTPRTHHRAWKNPVASRGGYRVFVSKRLLLLCFNLLLQEGAEVVAGVLVAINEDGGGTLNAVLCGFSVDHVHEGAPLAIVHIGADGSVVLRSDVGDLLVVHVAAALVSKDLTLVVQEFAGADLVGHGVCCCRVTCGVSGG
nr:MAG TPA: hypothetical protein [Caudoviricetes sp.]